MPTCTCSSASTPKATTSGTPPRARTSGSRTSTRCRGCTRCSRGTASGRPTSSPIRSRPMPASADVLRALLAGGDCEIGAHHHAWETPPCTADDVAAAPLRVDAAARAVRGAARVAHRRRSTAAVGARPVSYRSGRFGFSADHVAALERLGYLVESSVAPLFYETHKGGPGVRRGAADARTSSPTTARRGRARATCSRCRCRAALNRRLPKALQYRLRARAAAVHDQARAAEARARCACAGCGRRIRRSRT